MDLQVPLNRLKFGHEDGAGINARVTGRDDGIAELAANLHARGQIENLVVKACGEGFYSVSNGNRRLAAFHMIHGPESDQVIRCTLREVDEAGAFEDSLTTAVTAKQLHPVDQYEAFVRLRDTNGKTNEEIARVYGMTERQVEQALALGHLSPRIRDAWRKGDLKTEAAKAFTLALDHKSQDEILDNFADRFPNRHLVEMDDDDVKQWLKVGYSQAGILVEFVGIDAYVARGGKVTRDLFGTDHRVSDEKLAKAMASERFADECKRLKSAGWSFAVTSESVRNTKHEYGRLKVEDTPTDDERQKLDALTATFDPHGNLGDHGAPGYHDLSGPAQLAYRLHQQMTETIHLRCYTPKMMETAGCFVGVDEYGMLEVSYGHVKPKQKEQAAQVAKEEKREQAKAAAKSAQAEGKPAPAPTTLSTALKDRMEQWLVGATRDAIGDEPQLVNSPLFELLARIVCAQIVPDRNYGTPDAIRTKFPTIRQALNPVVFNAALAKRFDAENYFSSAPRGLVVKAIAEAINADEARKASIGKTKAEIWKFALGNVTKTGWLPKELRTVHYKGPGSEGYKAPAAAAPAPAAVKRETPAPKPSTAETIRKAKADRAAKAGAIAQKRVAKVAAKKTAKKTKKR